MGFFSSKPSKDEIYKAVETVIATGYVDYAPYLLTFLRNEISNSDVNYDLFLSKLDKNWYEDVFQKSMYRYFKLSVMYLQDENSWSEKEQNQVNKCYEQIYKMQEKIKSDIKTKFKSLGDDATEQIENAFFNTLNEAIKCGKEFANKKIY